MLTFQSKAGYYCLAVTQLEWVHTTLGGTPRVYSLVNQILDMIIKVRDTSLQHYGKDLSKLIIPFKIKDLEWAARHCSQLSLTLEGFLGTLDTYFGESW